MFPIFSMKFANKLVGMGRDGFCQAISLHLQLINRIGRDDLPLVSQLTSSLSRFDFQTNSTCMYSMMFVPSTFELFVHVKLRSQP